MNNEIFTVRHNVMDISTFDGFGSVKGRLNNGCKDVYFIRMDGLGSNLSDNIVRLDGSAVKAVRNGVFAFYNRISELPKFVSAGDAEFYSGCVKAWKNSGKTALQIRRVHENAMCRQLSSALANTIKIFENIRSGASASITENFAAKLLYWFDYALSGFSGSLSGKETVKICAHNISKPQEYLFFYMLTLAGFDVLLVQSECDIDESLDKYNFSKKVILGAFGRCDITEYDPKRYEPRNVNRQTEICTARVPQSAANNSSGNVRITIPEHSRRTTVQQAVGFGDTRSVQKEKTMEELALLASSVVLITIHNNHGEPVGTGSGIMVSEKGYILTNNHVARGGRFFTVRIEDDEQVYTTDEIIKYNQVIDLAVIRIDRRLKPIPVYSGTQKLVRGQKVAAIGSPLGLFNSVSDGIISGFRVIDDVDMIQFTAPISHGSSGGAILNMSGEVIGISTAGIESGQNLNLAVGYEYINTFLKGLI